MLEYEELLAIKTNSTVASNVVYFLVIHPQVQEYDIYFSWSMITADPDDNKYVDCAIAAGAHCIVSDDKQLQAAKNSQFPTVKVLTSKEFASEFK